MKERCPNMNHGKANAPVCFCPNCGESVNSKISKRCDKDIHASRRKDRSVFCQDCGVRLASTGR